MLSKSKLLVSARVFFVDWSDERGAKIVRDSFLFAIKGATVYFNANQLEETSQKNLGRGDKSIKKQSYAGRS